MNHPDVIGFVYINEDISKKAFLPKKLVNFKASTQANKKVIVAFSGDTEDYTPFLFQKKLLSNGLHFTDYNRFSEYTSSILIGKFLKENEKNLPPLPLGIISFPLILPIVKGFDYREGLIADNGIYDKFSETLELYADWIYIHNRKNVVSNDFSKENRKFLCQKKLAILFYITPSFLSR